MFGQGGGGATVEMADGVAKTDQLYSILSNRRRRYTIHLLKQNDERMNLAELATQIAAIEGDTVPEEVTSDKRRSVYTSLQQMHLPKMDETGLLAFNKERGTVDPKPELEEVEVYMEVIEGNQLPWHQYYVGLSATTIALLVALWVEAWPFILVSDQVWATLIVAVFAISSVAHYWSMVRRRIPTGVFSGE